MRRRRGRGRAGGGGGLYEMKCEAPPPARSRQIIRTTASFYGKHTRLFKQHTSTSKPFKLHEGTTL